MDYSEGVDVSTILSVASKAGPCMRKERRSRGCSSLWTRGSLPAPSRCSAGSRPTLMSPTMSPSSCLHRHPGRIELVE